MAFYNFVLVNARCVKLTGRTLLLFNNLCNFGDPVEIRQDVMILQLKSVLQNDFGSYLRNDISDLKSDCRFELAVKNWHGTTAGTAFYSNRNCHVLLFVRYWTWNLSNFWAECWWISTIAKTYPPTSFEPKIV